MDLFFMKRNRIGYRLFFLFSFLLLLFTLLFSVFYIVHEIGHDCSGEDCPVCACIAQCENIVQQIGYALIVATGAFLVFCSLIDGRRLPERNTLVYLTPVGKKVRLDN